jgi:hypothetical protein
VALWSEYPVLGPPGGPFAPWAEFDATILAVSRKMPATRLISFVGSQPCPPACRVARALRTRSRWRCAPRSIEIGINTQLTFPYLYVPPRRPRDRRGARYLMAITMNDSERPRDFVAQLLALALRARENGDIALSEEVIARALAYEDRAGALEEAASAACPAALAS